MPSLSEVKKNGDLASIKGTRVSSGLLELGITADVAEGCVDSSRALKQLQRIRESGGAMGSKAARLAHEIKVLMWLYGESPSVITEQDISTSDLDAEVLEFIVAPEMGIKYLDYAPVRQRNTLEGVIWGITYRPFVILAVSKGVDTPAYKVIFLLDTGAPATLVSRQVMEKLGHTKAVPARTNMIINGTVASVGLAAGERVEGINILGGDLLKITDAVVNMQYQSLTFSLVFRGESAEATEVAAVPATI